VALLWKVWKKIKEHSRVRGLPPRGAAMCMEGWTTRRKVVIFVECWGCDYKGTKTEKNRGQEFLQKEQLSNMWCRSYKEVWNWRNREAESGRAERVKCSTCGGKDVVIGEKVERNKEEEVFCPPCRTGKKMPWWNWGGRLEQTTPRAQKGRAGITDPRRMAETVNQKTVQKGEAREVK